ncbi:hypothetical protein NHQ30_004516 [Ciborinia camelliae]|nr:hypothetical protein NHQ30_004516 [Ciborinia camelliae]
MEFIWAKDGIIDPKLLLCVCGLIFALAVFILSNRTEKIVGIPAMTGYGLDHERAMMEGALKKKEMGSEFTGIFQHNLEIALGLRSDLNRNLANTLNHMEDKISWVLEEELAPRFTRDDEWNHLSLRLTVDLLQAIRDAIKWWPTFLQPILGPFLPEIRKANQYILRMTEMLKPVITGCLLETSGATTPLYEKKKKGVGNRRWGGRRRG